MGKLELCIDIYFSYANYEVLESFPRPFKVLGLRDRIELCIHKGKKSESCTITVRESFELCKIFMYLCTKQTLETWNFLSFKVSVTYFTLFLVSQPVSLRRKLVYLLLKMKHNRSPTQNFIRSPFQSFNIEYTVKLKNPYILIQNKTFTFFTL